ADGATFNTVGSFTQVLTVADLGPFVGNFSDGSAPAFTAAIDYFLSGSGPNLTLFKSHSGNFTQGQTGAAYTLTVSNAGTSATSGTVMAADIRRAARPATAISGSGWTCTLASLTCTRSDALATGSSFPPITLTVNVAGNAPASVTNRATLSGGGTSTNSNASDPTTITGSIAAPSLTLTKSHNGSFTQGQTGATY